MSKRKDVKVVLCGRGIVGGIVEGEALVSQERIAGSIGFRPDGTIYSKRQPGEDVDSKSFKGKVFVLKSSIGSSGYCSDFLNACKKGNGPLAMLVPKMTTYVVQSAIETSTPTIVDFDRDPCDVIKTGDWIMVDANKGEVKVQKK